VGADDRLGVDLRQGACRQLAPQARRSTQGRVGAALGVRHHHREAAVAQLVGGGVEVVAQRVEGSLHQLPARPMRTLRDHLELGLREASHHLVTQFAARAQVYFDAGGRQNGAQLANALDHLPYIGHEVGPHVRRGHHGAGAVRDRQRQQLNALLQSCRPVVQPGKSVEVNFGTRLRSRHRGMQNRPFCRAFGHFLVTGACPTSERPGEEPHHVPEGSGLIAILRALAGHLAGRAPPLVR